MEEQADSGASVYEGKNIYEKLIEVRKSVPFLQKGEEGPQYKYVSSSQTLSAVREAMDEQQLVLIPAVIENQMVLIPRGQDSSGNPKPTAVFTELTMTFTWVSAENPIEQIRCGWYGQGIDIAGEKGVGKALTYAEKYFLLKFFNVPTDKDDPDSQQAAPRPTEPPKTSTSAPTGDGLTDKQRRKIWAVSKELWGSDEDAGKELKEIMVGRYKKVSSTALTKKEASDLIEFLETVRKSKEKSDDTAGDGEVPNWA